MIRVILTIALAVATWAAAAQKPVPVEEPTRQQEADLQRGQFRAGQAYRELQQRRYEAKLAEQEVLNTEEAYKHAQQQADELKRQLDAARKALAAARANETAARERYDRELDAVHRLRQKAPPAK